MSSAEKKCPICDTPFATSVQVKDLVERRKEVQFGTGTCYSKIGLYHGAPEVDWRARYMALAGNTEGHSDGEFEVASDLQTIRKNLVKLRDVATMAIETIEQSDPRASLPNVSLHVSDLHEALNHAMFAQCHLNGILAIVGPGVLRHVSKKGYDFLKAMITGKA